MTILLILSPTERKKFDSPPVFTSEERKRFFTISGSVEKEIDALRTEINKIGFILQLGYFKAVKRFFPKHTFLQQDIEFVTKRLGLSMSDLQEYDNETVSRHRKRILRHMGYAAFIKRSYALVSNEATLLITKQIKLRKVFFGLLNFLSHNKIEVPTYYRLANIITAALREYEKDILLSLEKVLTKNNKLRLDELLTVDATYKTSKKTDVKIKRYTVTLLKKPSQSIKPTKIKETIQNLSIFQQLFNELEQAIQILQLPVEVTQLYATAVVKSQIFQLLRRDNKKYLYLLAFVIHQYYTLQDLLLDILILSIQSTLNKVVASQKENMFVMRKTKTHAIEEIVISLKTRQEILQQARTIFENPSLNDLERLHLLRKLIMQNTKPSKAIDGVIDMLQKETLSISRDDDYYNILEANSLKLQNRVSGIVKHVAFDVATSQKNIIEAIEYYKLHDGNITDLAPIDFLDETEQTVIFNSQGKLRISLYKVLLFIHIASLIKSGGLNLIHSYKYKAFDAYLLSQDLWDSQKENQLQKAHLSEFLDIQILINTLITKLRLQYEKTNHNIKQGKNTYLKIRTNGSFQVLTPKQEGSEETSTIDLFPKPRSIPLLSILATVNNLTHFVDCFEHFQIKHVTKKPEQKTFFAGIIGLGCNIGTAQIAQMSRNIEQNELENTVNWYFSAENLLAANDSILTFISKLGLPKLFKKDQDKTHTSSDGQKFAIGVDSLNANHSYKYFGSGKGVSVYSFIDDTHSLFYSTVISSSEREAAYVIDGLLHNDVVKSDIHSTDTHGYSEIIFAITYLLGYSFAPRIRNFQEQRIYSFETRKAYEEKGFVILPSERIHREIIEEQWNQILRFVATIQLRETSASQLLKRLSSYSKQHPLYRALKAFGQIIKTLYLLQYSDDTNLRQTVEKQLNKLESSNKFAKAVFYGNNQEFQQGTKEEQLISEGCKRLIENAIILWNYLYVSQKLVDIESEEEKKHLKTMIKNSSIVAWEHINLHGEYDFSEDKMKSMISFSLPKILDLSL